MKSIYATKKLQSTELYQELQHNLKDYFAVSLAKEQKQKEKLISDNQAKGFSLG